MNKLTWQDAATFAIGLGVALAVVLGEALVRSQEITDDPEKWAIGLLTGLLAAAGRFLLTFLTQRALL